MLWPEKVTEPLEVAVTYFMTLKVLVTFDLVFKLKASIQAFNLACDHKCPDNTIMR